MAQCLLYLLEQPKPPNPGTVKTRTKGEEIMMPRRLVLFAVATSLALVLVRTAVAQNASINGTVTDSTGALVQNATVTATNTATNVARSVQTGTAGVYSINEIVAGLYDLTVEKEGFRPVRFA